MRFSGSWKVLRHPSQTSFPSHVCYCIDIFALPNRPPSHHLTAEWGKKPKAARNLVYITFFHFPFFSLCRRCWDGKIFCKDFSIYSRHLSHSFLYQFYNAMASIHRAEPKAEMSKLKINKREEKKTSEKILRPNPFGCCCTLKTLLRSIGKAFFNFPHPLQATLKKAIAIGLFKDLTNGSRMPPNTRVNRYTHFNGNLFRMYIFFCFYFSLSRQTQLLVPSYTPARSPSPAHQKKNHPSREKFFQLSHIHTNTFSLATTPCHLFPCRLLSSSFSGLFNVCFTVDDLQAGECRGGVKE